MARIEHHFHPNTHYGRTTITPVPIDRERLETGDALGDRPTGERVLGFLLEHDDLAYTRSELAAAIDAAPETVGTNLTRLKERGLVRHREPYWTITEDHALVRGTLRDRYGTPVGDDHAPGPPGDEETTTNDRDGSPHRAAARAFIERVRDRFDGAIDELYLFGSVAREAATPHSDVDVLAVVAADADYAAVDDALLDLAYDVQLAFDVRIEVHAIRASEFADRRDRGDPFVRAVLEEGEAGV